MDVISNVLKAKQILETGTTLSQLIICRFVLSRMEPHAMGNHQWIPTIGRRRFQTSLSEHRNWQCCIQNAFEREVLDQIWLFGCSFTLLQGPPEAHSLVSGHCSRVWRQTSLACTRYIQTTIQESTYTSSLLLYVYESLSLLYDVYIKEGNYLSIKLNQLYQQV